MIFLTLFLSSSIYFFVSVFPVLDVCQLIIRVQDDENWTTEQIKAEMQKVKDEHAEDEGMYFRVLVLITLECHRDDHSHHSQEILIMSDFLICFFKLNQTQAKMGETFFNFLSPGSSVLILIVRRTTALSSRICL